MNKRSARELAIVLAFAALPALLMLGKPFHMDEPLFLAPARHIVVDPLHPFDFEFNWYGRGVPMASINNTPPLMLYALAGAWKLTGGREWAMRLVFVPANLFAAAALYLLAGLFLSEPLGPVLVVLAGPSYLINMNLLYPELLGAAFGFWGLYLLALALEKKKGKWFWVSAALCGAAVFAKYGFVFLVPSAVIYCLKRKVSWARIAAFVGISAIPIAAYLVYDSLTSHSAVGAVMRVLSQSASLPTSGWAHQLRSILAFTGGLGLATALWPFAEFKEKKTVWLGLAVVVLLLFAPAFDIASLVRPVDRLTGIVLAFGALAAFWELYARGLSRRGGVLWGAWAACVLAVQAFVYWSVLARVIMLLLPPLVFSMAEGLEKTLSAAKLKRLYVVSVAGVVCVSAALACVDWRYAAAQKDLAAEVVSLHPGARLWCAGHWGLQYYIEAAGGRELDLLRGGWDEVGPGDIVVVPSVNSNVLRPRRQILADVGQVVVNEPLPLRLMSGYSGEGGFYSNVTGFLPYSVSREPLDEFDIVEVRAP